jgi:hypothetical protein
MADDVELTVEDDESDPVRVVQGVRRLAASCDLLLGPYSTQLMRAAARVVLEMDRLLWNQGGSGDDVEMAGPGRIVSVLTPTSRYSEPFLSRLARQKTRAPIWVVEGKGSFGRQVAAGVESIGRTLRLKIVRIGPRDPLPSTGAPLTWDLFCAGLFEEDVARIREARGLPRPPRLLCAVAAGVREFGAEIANPEGIYGVAQWFPGFGVTPEIGPSEPSFVTSYLTRTGVEPDYPAVQAAAAAAIATHCARSASSVAPDALWSIAASLDTSTLFGGFRIDPSTGVQLKHETQLVLWTPTGLAAASTET